MDKAWKEAIQNGDLAAMHRLLEVRDHLDSQDEHGQTALMNAARSGKLEVVRYLITQGADLNHSAKYGLTALMLAIVNYRCEVAMALIEAGADVGRKGTGAPGFAGKTALELARERNQGDVVASLVEYLNQ